MSKWLCGAACLPMQYLSICGQKYSIGKHEAPNNRLSKRVCVAACLPTPQYLSTCGQTYSSARMLVNIAQYAWLILASRKLKAAYTSSFRPHTLVAWGLIH